MNSISIIVPLYNKVKYIKRTLQSVVVQNEQLWELIIIDDGSTDGSYEIAEAISQENPRIKLFKRIDFIPDRKGANICRNIGVTLAKGDYIMFLDADDLLTKNCIKQRQEYIRTHPLQDLYIFNVAYCKGKEATPYAKLKPSFSYYILHKFSKNLRTLYLNMFLKFDLPWHTSGPVWRKGFFEKIGGFDLKFQRLQDPVIHLKALLDPSIRIKNFMNESSYDVLHRNDDDRMVWGKEEFLRKQLDAIQTFIITFVPLVETNYSQKYLRLLQGYLLEAEKLVYRYSRSGYVPDFAKVKLKILYEMPEYHKIETFKYRIFRRFFSIVSKNTFAAKFKIPGILIYFFKKTL